MKYPSRVAIIDDDHELRRSLGTLMRAYDIDAKLFESAEAFLKAEPQPFDCVIADVHMPGIDGISMIGCLRDRGNRVPVIIISALDPDRTRAEAMARGALAFFPKPVDVAGLLELLAQVANSPSDDAR